MYRDGTKSDHWKDSILVHKLDKSKNPRGIQENRFFIYVEVKYPEDETTLLKYVEETVKQIMLAVILHNANEATKHRGIKLLWFPLLGGGQAAMQDKDAQIRLATTIVQALQLGAGSSSMYWPKVELAGDPNFGGDAFGKALKEEIPA